MQSDDDRLKSSSTNQNSQHGVQSAQRSAPTSTNARPRQLSTIFTTPEPLKRLFDRFPLYTYPANRLPLSASACHARAQRSSVLYIFAAPHASSSSSYGLSLNPSCLRYQTLLKLAGIPFETAVANNHASPSGSLPYLVTPEGDTSKIIAASGLKKFIQSRAPPEAVEMVASSAYLALLDPIRHAYLIALYLEDETFKKVCVPLYIDTASRSRLVRAALAPPLRAAALEEVLGAGNEAPATSIAGFGRGWTQGTQPVFDEAVYESASDAFTALSTLLGDSLWFGQMEGQAIPGWLDASVFAYTHVLLSLFETPLAGAKEDKAMRLGPGAKKMYQAAARHKNLVAHRSRILAAFG